MSKNITFQELVEKNEAFNQESSNKLLKYLSKFINKQHTLPSSLYFSIFLKEEIRIDSDIIKNYILNTHKFPDKTFIGYKRTYEKEFDAYEYRIAISEYF